MIEEKEMKRDDSNVAAVSASPVPAAAAAAVVVDHNDEDDDDDFFERLSLRQDKKKKKIVTATTAVKKRRSNKLLSINVHVTTAASGNKDGAADTTTTTATTASAAFSVEEKVDIYDDNDNHLSMKYYDSYYNDDIINDADNDDDDDFLSFYKDTHEEQDPAYILRLQQQQTLQIQQQLQQIEAQNVAGRQEIETFISDLLTEKQASAERSVEAYKERAILEEKTMTNKLQQVYVQKTQSHQRKVAATVKFLQTRQQKEVTTELKNHQQRHQQQNPNHQHAAAAEWQQVLGQLQGKHQMQMAELHRKGNEVKAKLEMDYKREMEKITKTRLLKFTEIEGKRQKLVQQFLTHFTSLRQRYLKRHFTKMQKLQQKVLQLQQQRQQSQSQSTNNINNNNNNNMDDSSSARNHHHHHHHSNQASSTTATTLREMAKSTMEDKEELRPPSPLKSIPDWIHEQQQHHQQQQHDHAEHHEESSSSLLAGAAARHKHRKSVLSQTSRQLSVEIHNEGLWILAVSNGNNSNINNNNMNDNTMTTTGTASENINNNSDNLEQTFMCWGLKAFTFLESIVCGEIPNELQHFVFGIDASNNNTNSNNNMANAWMNTQSMGGQVRCVVTDLRTSHETASSQRAVALRLEQEAVIQKLQQEAQDCTNLASLAEKAVKDVEAAEQQAVAQLQVAMDNVQKAKRIQEEFNNKFRSFIGPDGSPLPTTNPNDRNELIKAMMRYKTNCENTVNKEREARQALSDIKTQQVQLQINAKNALKNATYMAGLLKRKKMIQESNNYMNNSSSNSAATTTSTSSNNNNYRLSEAVEAERAATRVKDVIESFRKTAERRREQLNQKKSTSFSSAWIQSFPNLPMALKKSLWHKMHRRKQQIVLRPAGMVDELRMHVANVTHQAHLQKSMINMSSTSSLPSSSSSGDLSLSQRQEAIEQEMLKAEQLYLLSCHPPADPERSSVPPLKSSEQWGEPGWQLDLSVPEKRDTSDRILPCAPSFPLLEKNLSEMASAPGRQAANLMRSSILRSLTVPLSAVAVASSPAEITTSLLRPRELTEGDPLLIRDDELKNGYTFSLKPPAPKIAAPSRRKAAPVVPKDDTSKPSAPAAPKPAPAVPAASSSTAATSESRQQKQPTKAQQKSAAAAASDKSKPTQAKKRRSTSKSTEGPSKRRRESAASAKAAAAASEAAAAAAAAAARSRKPPASSAQTIAPASHLSQQQQQQQHLFQMQAAQQQQQALQAQQMQAAQQQQQLHQQQQQQQQPQQTQQPQPQPQAQIQTQQKQKQAQPKPRSQTQKPAKSQQQKQQKQPQQLRGQTQQQQLQQHHSHHYQPQTQQRGQIQQQQLPQQQQHIPQPQQQQPHQQQQPPPQQQQQHQQYAQQQQHFPSPQQRQQMAQAQAQLRMMQQNAAAAAAAAAARGGPQMSYSQAMAQMPQFYAQQAPHGQYQTGLSPMHLQGRAGMTYPGVVAPMPGAATTAAAMAGQHQQGLPVQGPPGNALGGPQQPQQQQQQNGANAKDQNDPLYMLK